MRSAFLLPALLLLHACAAHRPPLSAGQQGTVSAASFLPDELVVDLAARTVLGARVSRYDVAGWKLNRTLEELLREGSKERGQPFQALNLDPLAVEKARHVRESRWLRIEGKYSQALLDLLLRTAEAQGVKRLFVVVPVGHPERPTLQKGSFGVRCFESKEEGARASVYFSFLFSLWDVPAKRKLFEHEVTPSVTEVMTFGDCARVAEVKDPAHDLEDPMKRTLGLVVDALFDKLGWKKP